MTSLGVKFTCISNCTALRQVQTSTSTYSWSNKTITIDTWYFAIFKIPSGGQRIALH